MTSRTSGGKGGGGTRERMLDVAETHFARKGYEGAHLESIASEVGVRKTALYYYFDSKSALYTAVLDRISVELDRVVVGALGGAGLTHVARLEQLLQDLNALLARNLNYSQILLRIFVDRIPLSDDSVLTPSLERVMVSVMSFYLEGKRAGVFRPLSARHFLISLLGMSTFYYAGRESSGMVLGVEDVAASENVSWRQKELQNLVFHGVLQGDA
jgi:AcrR family transcriptional regulator